MATTGNERGEKRNDGISERKQYSQANPGPERNCWSWKEDCLGTPAAEGCVGPGARAEESEHQRTEEMRAERGRQA